METVKVECSACGGTGLYSGFAEPKGTAVICFDCDGSGYEEIAFTPFTHRKGKRGINIVKRSRGSFVGTGVGPVGASITYNEFQIGRMP